MPNDVYGRSRRWFAALACLREWSAQGERVSVVAIGAATNSLAKCALWMRALRMIAAPDAFPNTFVANAVVSACCRAKLPGRAAKIVDMMSQRGPQPDAVTLNTLLGLYATERLASKAQGLMSSTNALSLEPDLLSFNLYLNAMQRSAKWSESLLCLEKIRSNSLSGDTVTLNSVLAADTRCMQWQHGLTIAFQRENFNSYNVVALSTVSSGMIQQSVWTSACHILQLVNSSGLEPDADAYAVLGSSCMLAVRYVGETGAAGKLWQVASRLLAACNLQQIRATGVANGVLIGSSLATCSRSRQWQLSMNLLADVQKRSLEVNHMVAYNSICPGSWRQSHLIFKEISCRRLEPDLASWNSLMASTSSWKMCWNYLETLCFQSLEVDQVLLSTSLGAMNTAPWRASMEAIKNAAHMVSDRILISVVLRGTAKLSLWQRSLQLSQGIHKTLLSRNDTDSGLQNAVLTAYQEGNAWPQGFQLLKDLVLCRCEPQGLGVSAVFTACGVSSNWKAMLTAANFLRDGLELRSRSILPKLTTAICDNWENQKVSGSGLRWVCRQLVQRKLWSFSAKLRAI